jgi:hypothetical protein
MVLSILVDVKKNEFSQKLLGKGSNSFKQRKTKDMQSGKDGLEKSGLKRLNNSFAEPESELLYDIKPQLKIGRQHEPSSPVRAQLRKNTGLMQFRRVQHLRRKSCICSKCGGISNFQIKVGLLRTEINQHIRTFNTSLLKIHTRGPSTPPANKSNSLTVFEKFKAIRALTPVLTKKNYIDILRKEVRRQTTVRDRSPLLQDPNKSMNKQIRLSPRGREDFLRPEERRFSFQADETSKKNYSVNSLRYKFLWYNNLGGCGNIASINVLEIKIIAFLFY